jgi:hypothetical protein
MPGAPTGAPPKALRFGVMCNGDQMEAAFAEAVRELLRVEGVTLALVIVDADPPARSTRAEKLRKLATFQGALWALYQRLFPMRALPCYRPSEMSDVFAGVPRIECSVERRGRYSQYFRPEDVEAIRAHRLDFILRFAFGIIRGDVLRAPTYGVWSYHHGDELKFRGAPPAFWEIYDGEPTTAAILQRLTDRLDAGVVLQKCFLQTRRYSYAESLDSLVRATSYMPARVARDLLNGCASYLEAAPSRTAAPIRRAPSDLQMLAFAARSGGAWLTRQVRAVLFSESWNVGIVRAPIETFLRPDARPPVAWLPYTRRNAFVADPFVLRTGPDEAILLMEEFDDLANRGAVVQAEVRRGALASPLRPAIDDGVHVAYPYLFEHAGRIYCVPEAAAKGGVFLYAYDPELGRWTEVAALVRGLPAVDPTIIHRDGRWWLFCTHRDDEVESKLLLWHAPDLLGPWTPHPGNPVKVDVRSSRPAGTPFVFEGTLYRPAQDSSLTYGGGITINRVTLLTPTEFREEAVTHLGPRADGPFALGTHTLAGSGDLTVIDGKRMAFAPALVGRRVRHKVKRLARALVRRGGGASPAGAGAAAER